MNSNGWCDWRVDSGRRAEGGGVADDFGSLAAIDLCCDVWARNGTGSIDSGGVSTECVGTWSQTGGLLGNDSDRLVEVDGHSWEGIGAWGLEDGNYRSWSNNDWGHSGVSRAGGWYNSLYGRYIESAL